MESRDDAVNVGARGKPDEGDAPPAARSEGAEAANSYAHHSLEELDAIILAMSGQIGRMVSASDADSSWIDSAGRELASARRARRALCGPVEDLESRAAAATIDPTERNPYDRFTDGELEALMVAQTAWIRRIVMSPATGNAARNIGGFLQAAVYEYRMMGAALILRHAANREGL